MHRIPSSRSSRSSLSGCACALLLGLIAPEGAAAALPLAFERRQDAAGTEFTARRSDLAVTLSSSALTLVFRPADSQSPPAHAVRMEFAGASRCAEAVQRDRLPGTVNRFVGNDPAQWRTNIPTHRRVGFRQVYPGVDLWLHGTDEELQYDFIVAAGADPAQIRLQFHPPEAISINERGDLIIGIGSRSVRHRSPILYQTIGQRRRQIEGRFRIDRGEVRFQIGTYDSKLPLVIDPTVRFATFLGGTGNLPADRRDEGRSIAVDAQGNVYVAGFALSTNFPTTSGAFRATDPDFATVLNASDAFVSKIRADGSALEYSTYLGGIGLDEAHGIAVDASGSAVVVGHTRANDFPIRNALQPANRGGFSNEDAFVTKLAPAGNDLLFSTFLGGAADSGGIGGNDRARDVALDSVGHIYVVGRTSSPDFPTSNAAQTTLRGIQDVFVTKIERSGARLMYSTFVGGNDEDEGNAIAVDSAGSAYVTGLTPSTDFPVVNAFQPSTGGGSDEQDAFVTKLHPSGASFVYSTYLGGSGEENPFGNGGIGVDSAGSAYVTGQTNSNNFPVRNALQPAKGGGSTTFNPDVFVAKFTPAGDALVYSTYLGGGEGDGGNDLAVDPQGNTFVTGYTNSPDFRLQLPLQSAKSGAIDIFVAQLSPNGALAYSTFLGGTLDDLAYDIALDAAANAYLSGTTASDDFPVASALQRNRSGGFDAVVIKIASDALARPRRRAVPK